MAEFVLAGQGGAFGQGVGQGAEFEGFEQSGQISADGVGGGTDNGADICAYADTTDAASIITPNIPVRTTA